VTTPAANGRIKLGAQVVQTLVEHGFIGEHKWDSIILVGTKSDRANEDEKAFFRNNVVKDFFGKAPPGTSPKFALTTDQDVSQLVTQIGSLPGVPIEYRQPETASLAQIFAAKFGIPGEAFSTAFDQIRDQLANQAMAAIEEERRQIEQLRQEQAAAEAKGKAEAAELARQLAALQEQLKLQQERIVRARPSTVNGTWNGITYLRSGLVQCELAGKKKPRWVVLGAKSVAIYGDKKLFSDARPLKATLDLRREVQRVVCNSTSSFAIILKEDVKAPGAKPKDKPIAKAGESINFESDDSKELTAWVTDITAVWRAGQQF
jgi:hypothetical protein